MSKVVELTLADFRGVSGELTLSLSDPVDGSPTSVVLFGDNGAGKSSVVDALEFGLRGRLSRRTVGGIKQKREVRNLATSRPPGVILEFSDGTYLRRGGGLGRRQIPQTKASQLADGYQFSPVIIRRHDIEEFWRIPASDRKAFFFDYLRSSYENINPPEVDAKLRADHDEALRRHANASANLMRLTGLSLKQLPTSRRGTVPFLTRTLIPRFGQQAGKKRRLPTDLQNAYRELVGAIERKNYIAGVVRALPEPSPLLDEQLTPLLERVSRRVSADFTAIANLKWVVSVAIVPGSGDELTIELTLLNEQRADPVQVLSEGALDVLALLVLLEAHIACSDLGQTPLIVLDDVFQSVDSVNRIRALNYIVERLRGWQVVLTFHDRLWLALAEKALHRANHRFITRELLAGEFGGLPTLKYISLRSAGELREQVETKQSSETIAASAGRVLEELCQELSICLGTSIIRKPGDVYTLGDLWPGVFRVLKKHGTDRLRDVSESVNTCIDLRNLVGAHFNEWAGGISSAEALDFGVHVLDLWAECSCPACGSIYSKLRPAAGKAIVYGLPCECDVAESGDADSD